MGHERCGGIEAALTGRFHDAPAGEGGFIASLDGPDRRQSAAIAEEHGTGQDAAGC